MWQKVVERFEERAPGAVMAHLAMDQAGRIAIVDTAMGVSSMWCYA